MSLDELIGAYEDELGIELPMEDSIVAEISQEVNLLKQASS